MKQFKFITLAVVFLCAFNINAQQRLEKFSKSVKANKDVTLNLNTSYANIEIDTWDKNEVQVEAFIESKELTKEELQKFLENWEVEFEGSGSDITIETHGGSESNWDFNFNFDGEALEALEDLQFVIADMPEIPEMPEMPEINIEIPEIPEMPEMEFEMPEMPEMPELPELPEGVHNVNFDFEAYKKDGEKYLEKWSKNYEKKYGKEYKDKMKAWAKEFSKTDFDQYSKDMEAWGEKFGKTFGKDYEAKMEVWSKNFEKNFGPEWEAKMEDWGKEIEKKFDGKWTKDMEEWGEKFGEKFGKEWEEKMEKQGRRLEERMEGIDLHFGGDSKNNKVIKTIKIRMPKDTKLKVNVRHGELKFTAVNNLKAELSHSTLLAEHINGSNTSINAAYTPVFVTNWNAGELKLNYVDNAVLKNAKGLILSSNSSNVNIGNLSGNSMMDGSFGDLTIKNILNSFNNLNIVLENSDALIKLPKTKFNLQYQGKRSQVEHPTKSFEGSTFTFSTGDMSSNKAIIINAKYSNIVMQ